ncbi:MAG TPA: hypothetical protein VFS91_05310, partial [Nitrobacter sp.]|nr:hypothetical protein [Nitrobacter sp.]
AMRSYGWDEVMIFGDFCGCCRLVSFPVAPAVVETTLNRALQSRVEASIGPWLASTTRATLPMPEKREIVVGEAGVGRRFTRKASPI